MSAVLGASMLVGCSSTSDTTTPSTDTQTTTKTETPATTTETPVAEATDSGFSGTLSLMHFSTSEESQGNGGSDGFRTMIAEWKAANPSITLNENVLANDEYKTQIATLSAAGDMPDVFLLQGMNTKAWASQGIILDMTDIIEASPYEYNTAMFTPFKDDDGNVYAIPALTVGTCTFVVYDKAMW